MPLWRTHLACPELMNWSMMHWAVLWKSPNCASHRTRALGLAMAKPSSNPGKENGGHRSAAAGVHGSPTYQARRTRTRSCCRRCRAPGRPTGGSWGHRFVCPPLGHGEHDDGDLGEKKKRTTKTWKFFCNNTKPKVAKFKSTKTSAHVHTVPSSVHRGPH